MEHVVWGEVSESLSEDRSIESSDEDFARDNEDLLFEHQQGLAREFGEQFDKFEADLNERNSVIDLQIDERLVYDRFEERRHLSALEDLINDINDQLAEAKRRELEGLEREVDKEKQRIVDKERSARKKMRRNVGLAIFGALAVLGTSLYFLIKWLLSDKKTSDQFTAADAASAEKLIADWKKLDDTQFWARIGEYVKKNNPSFEFQMQMMGYTKLLADDTNAPKFSWTRTQKLDAIDQLVKAFTGSPEKKGKKSAAIYEALVKIRPDNRPLPRSLGADIAETALAHIIALGRAEEKAS
jgi:hypothetical protein